MIGGDAEHGVGDLNFSCAAEREVASDENEFDAQRGDQGERRYVMQEGEQRRHRVLLEAFGDQASRKTAGALCKDPGSAMQITLSRPACFTARQTET